MLVLGLSRCKPGLSPVLCHAWKRLWAPAYYSTVHRNTDTPPAGAPQTKTIRRSTKAEDAAKTRLPKSDASVLSSVRTLGRAHIGLRSRIRQRLRKSNPDLSRIIGRPYSDDDPEVVFIRRRSREGASLYTITRELKRGLNHVSARKPVPAHMNTPGLTIADMQQIQLLKASGVKTAEICRKTGRSHTVVYRALEGVAPLVELPKGKAAYSRSMPRKWTTPEIDRLIQLRHEGYSGAEIARLLERTTASVSAKTKILLHDGTLSAIYITPAESRQIKHCREELSMTFVAIAKLLDRPVQTVHHHYNYKIRKPESAAAVKKEKDSGKE